MYYYSFRYLIIYSIVILLINNLLIRVSLLKCKNPSCHTLAVEPHDPKGTISVCLVSRQCVATYTLLTVVHVHLARDPDIEYNSVGK